MHQIITSKKIYTKYFYKVNYQKYLINNKHNQSRKNCFNFLYYQLTPYQDKNSNTFYKNSIIEERSQMITNFQIKQRKCKYHNNVQQYICMHKQCQYRASLCIQCIRQNHSNHLEQVRSINSFIQTFKNKVKYYQSQFQKDKIVINVKQIIKLKINQLDQIMNDIFINMVKILESQKRQLCDKLKSIQDKYESMQLQYKKNLQHRFDCLQFLSAYKASPQTLNARLLTSSEWGIVSLKNALIDIKNLSLNQERNISQLTSIIIQQTQNLFNQDNFINLTKKNIQEYYNQVEYRQYHNSKRNQRITSFIEKSFINTTNNTTIINTPKSSRAIVQGNIRQRTLSLGGINQGLSRMTSNPNIQIRKPSLQQIAKSPSDNNLILIINQNNQHNQQNNYQFNQNQQFNQSNGNKYLKGLKKLQISKAAVQLGRAK